jgi:DNA-directed RNA polymerase
MEARKMLEKDLHGRQRHLESSVYDLALEQLQYRAKVFAEKGIDQESHLRDSELQSWMWTWHTRLVERLKVEIIRIQRSEKRSDVNMAPYVTLINPEKLSLLTILELMRLQGSGGVSLGMKTTRALIDVGKAVENEYKAQMCKKHDIPLPQHISNKTNFFSLAGYQHLRQIRTAAAASMEYGDVWSATWSQVARSQIGAVLVECLMDVAEVTRMKVDPLTHKLLYVTCTLFFD